MMAARGDLPSAVRDSEVTVSTPGTDLSARAAQGTVGAQSVDGSADIAVTKTSPVTEAKVGEQFVYTMTVRNNGPDAARR